ncbi:MAG: hypothetical protein E3K29_11280 [Candidatus Brocadia sp.]|nr:hypothetical protein [Candidatus Brocadia sp.]
MNQGYLIERVTVLGGRAFIVARKHRNGCGAKGVKTFVPEQLSDGGNRIRDYCSWGSSDRGKRSESIETHDRADRVKHAEKQRQMVGTGAIPILPMIRQVTVIVLLHKNFF